jgi:hypothetical protein
MVSPSGGWPISWLSAGTLDGLRARGIANDEAAASRLADLLIKQGQGEEAVRLRWFGSPARTARTSDT